MQNWNFWEGKYVLPLNYYFSGTYAPSTSISRIHEIAQQTATFPSAYVM